VDGPQVKIVFRVDGDARIGSGHIMRCLSLADRLRQADCDCTFVYRGGMGSPADTIRARGFEALELPAFGNGLVQELKALEESGFFARLGQLWELDAQQTEAVLGTERYDWLIVDHYALDERWESRLRPRCGRLMAIDDLANRKHDCDLLLDQNLVDGYEDRYRDRVPSGCGQMLGPEFALLHHSYLSARRTVQPRRPPIRKILVYFGGADSSNLTGLALSAFRELESQELRMDVVLSSGSPWLQENRRQAAQDPRITSHENLSSLAPRMLEADLSIGACGTTTWERCCLGLPSLVITLASNQIPIAEELNRRGIVRWLGSKDQVDAQRLAEAIELAIGASSFLEWSQACYELVDGLGATRVASFLTLSSTTPLRARAVTACDEKRILDWANDPLVRANAFHSSRINAETHHRWFTARLGDGGSGRFYVIETIDSVPIGQVRFSKGEGFWEVHYALDPRARGRGMGRPLLESGIQRFASEFRDILLVGRVKSNNLASIRIFEDLGFLPSTGQDSQEIVFQKKWI
jgi:UDP-2,4-diacetamido-2,4,6-trideoxy-beta-L-altropyranose hydrolase